MSTMTRIGVAVALASALAFGGGCKKKDDAKTDTKEQKKDDKAKGGGEMKAPDKAPPPAAAKPTKEDCEKVVQHQLDLEKDESMKNAMKASHDGMIDGCMAANKAQVDCMMTAADGPAFADCIIKNP